MDAKKLYKWQRITSNSKPSPSYKRTPASKNVTDDIESWIKKVEEASDFAAAQAFGKARVNHNSKVSVMLTVDQLHEHDAACNEAQELLNNWAKEQIDLKFDDTEKQIWGDEKEEDNDLSSFQPSIQNIIQQTDPEALSMEEYERLMNIDNYNEGSAVQSVLEQLKGKEVVNKDFLLDLGDIGGKPTHTKPKKDPALKMQIRQSKVKETREKRRLEVVKKHEAEVARKEAVYNAKQRAAEERRKAHLKAKAEELEIQREMMRIRKELQEERKQQIRKQEEERELERRIARAAKSEANTEQAASSNTECTTKHTVIIDNDVEYQRKSRLATALQIAETRFTAKNLKLMKIAFNGWLDVVLERRIQLGKARAVSEWKCLFKAWNAWCYYVKDKTLGRIQQQHELEMVESHRKYHQASSHYNQTLLKQYMTNWILWTVKQRQLKEFNKDRSLVQQKVSQFLATGHKLALEKEEDLENKNSDSSNRDTSKVDEIFEDKTDRKIKTQKPRSKNAPVTEAWQVTRRQLKMTPTEIRQLTSKNDENVDDHSDPWMEAMEYSSDTTICPPKDVPKNFQNRFQAQQKILHEQQRALKEQRRMIEDLMLKKDKSLLEQQIQQQKAIQDQLDKLTKITLQERKLNSVIPKEATCQNTDKLNSPVDYDENANNSCPPTARSAASSSAKSRASTSFSRKMEQRALERIQAKKEREERRRQLEEQRVASDAEMLAKEEEVRLMEAEEKKKRIEAYKEKKRLEKQRELELQQLKEKAVADQKKADEHSRSRIIKFYGFNQIKVHWKNMKNMESSAFKQRCTTLQREAFQLWYLKYDTNITVRNEKADELYNLQLKRRCLKNWTQWRYQSRILAMKADRYYYNKVLSDVFKRWLDITTREKISMWEKERHSRQHDVMRLKCWVFRTWKRLPELKRQEAEREKRREEMRKKVSSLLSDFHLDSAACIDQE